MQAGCTSTSLTFKERAPFWPIQNMTAAPVAVPKHHNWCWQFTT